MDRIRVVNAANERKWSLFSPPSLWPDACWLLNRTYGNCQLISSSLLIGKGVEVARSSTSLEMMHAAFFYFFSLRLPASAMEINIFLLLLALSLSRSSWTKKCGVRDREKKARDEATVTRRAYQSECDDRRARARFQLIRSLLIRQGMFMRE